MNRSPNVDIAPFFLDGPGGPLFCLYLTPTDKILKGSVLYLHPFAEEMHKSRRMAALQARTLAANGYAVLQVDLTGCGDSWGDFGDASWSAWQADACATHAWLANKTGLPISLWGLRTGASLAVEVSQVLPNLDRLILWQPVTNGDLYLNQFLRIKLASEMLAEGQAQTGTKALRAKLENGEGVEVGGNMLSPAMASELSKIALAKLVPAHPIHWLEVGAKPGEHVNPASQRVIEAWRENGTPVHASTVEGEPFWLTQEITECPAQLQATVQAMRS